MKFVLLFLATLLTGLSTMAQNRYPADSALFRNYKYRCIGPFRGGRASGVCGDPVNKQVFYMGATGGGVWQTRDGGNNWRNISDKYFGGSIGSVEVCPTDPLLIYAGTGENTLRGNVSEGNGMWKSTDGGKTWKSCGLSDTRHITRIVFHPKNPETVYCTATGHLFGANEERGVFKTTNGGASWQKILFVNNEVGAVDLVMDPANPDILYASTWRVKRTPWSLESGGEGSRLWKTEDGGTTWKNISTKPGFPPAPLGMICLAISVQNSDKLYAMVESEKGGLYMSQDAGENWQKMNDESKIRQRAWYFSKVNVDPKNDQIVYVGNVEFYKSTDGGKTFNSLSTPHGDHHNLWIDPNEPKRMIVADDGGAQISFDGGQNWSTYMNQPTAQFYRVTTDTHFPYRVLGCQQDNSSVRILNQTYDGSIGAQDWSSTAGFESGYIAVDPLNDDIVYGGNYGGYISRLDHRSGERRTVSVYPVSPIGEGADTLTYRFQWNFPLLFSPHNPKRLYAAGNHLFVTEDEGQHWKKISPDLTTNNKKKQAPSGGIITKDNTGVEYYCTLFAVAESPVQKDLLWCGSDDGLLHISKNGGKDWELVNPEGLPEDFMFNCIEASPFDAGTCYVAGTSYKSDDDHPYIYKTTNFGQSWQLIVKGIPAHHFTRCIRSDQVKKGWLYCGTEHGMYLSTNDGKNWKSLQMNLPEVPVTDLCIKEDDLVVATQGRSFWILDDLSLLRQWADESNGSSTHSMGKLTVFNPSACYRMDGYQRNAPQNEGQNPVYGVRLDFDVADWSDSSKASISFYTTGDSLLRSFSTQSEKEDALKVSRGMNMFNWNLNVKGVERIDDMILWNSNIGGYKIPPGNYKAKIKVGSDSVWQDFKVLADPNYKISSDDYQNQFRMLTVIRNKFEEVQHCILDIRQIRSQVNGLKERYGTEYPTDLDSIGKTMLKSMSKVEESLYQTKAKSGQDLLNYPIRLNDKLSGIFDAANQETAPSQQVMEAYTELNLKIEKELNEFRSLTTGLLKTFNQKAREAGLDLITVKKRS